MGGLTPEQPTSLKRLERSSGSVPRLALGILLVLLATLGGTRLVHAASRTVEIWAAGKDLAPGKILEAGDVRTVAVRL
ncbi:MAG: hypothetical protein WDA71_13810, partial [Actinomycetota bacterium]